MTSEVFDAPETGQAIFPLSLSHIEEKGECAPA
jgi:hypothetical protein